MKTRQTSHRKCKVPFPNEIKYKFPAINRTGLKRKI